MNLADFAVTDRQREIAEMIQEGKSQRDIARHFGCHNKTVFQSLKGMRRRAALKGWSPEHDMTKACPETHYVKGTSTLYDGDGEQKLQWVKTAVDKDRLAAFAGELAESICQTVKPAKRVKRPARTEPDKLAVYPVGDAHIGLYCWSEDSEEDYDVGIATDMMTRGFDRVLRATPDAEQALVVNLGDWFHSDTIEGVTRRSGNQLDVDTRWAKVLRVGVHVMRYLLDQALSKHKRVHVINEVGNHDDQSSVMLSMVLDAYYSKEPRLTVDLSPDCFHWYEFGTNLIGVHHGHKCTPERLYKVMCEDKREACGRCRNRYWYIGHVHNSRKQDVGGVQVESFRTLIPGDAFTHGAGYRAPRDVCSIVLDGEYGECFRATVNVEAIR